MSVAPPLVGMSARNNLKGNIRKLLEQYGVDGGGIKNIAEKPDGEWVADKADGLAFSTTDNLTAGETYTSEWVNTNGYRDVEIVVLADQPSALNGLEIQFTDDAQADTPTVQSGEIETYSAEAVERGHETFVAATRLDGFRVNYTNGDTGTGTFSLFATLRANYSPEGAEYVRNNTLGEQFVQIGTSQSETGIEISSPASLFDDLATIERSTVVDLTSTFGTSVIRDEIASSGSGAVAQDPDASTGEIVLTTGGTADSDIQLQSAEYGRYTAGYSAQQGMGIRIPDLPTDSESEARWGYFDDDNGFYWGYDGDTGEMFVARRGGGTETERVTRSEWNRRDIDDVLNREWSPSEGDIFQIDFSWYGYGIILFSIVTQTDNDALPSSPRQRTIPVHAFAVTDETSTSDPNEPIRVVAENGTNGEDFDVRVGGRQFSVFGQAPEEARVTSETTINRTVSDGSWTFVQAWQRDIAEGNANSKLNIRGLSLSTNGDVRYAIVINPNTSGKTYGTPSLTNDDETLLKVSTTGTYDGLGSGTKVFGDHIDATGGGPSPVQGEGDADVNVRLGQNNEMVLLANGIGNSPTVTATLRMVEDW